MALEELRLLNAADCSAFRAIRAEGLAVSPSAFGESEAEFSRSTDEQVIHRFAGEQSRCAGYLLDGKLCGVAVLSRMWGEKSAHRGLIWGVYVQPQLRGKGVATKLMERVIQEVPTYRNPALRHLFLKVARGNAPAIALYKGLGFVECGVEPEALLINDSYVDEILMIRAFSE